MSGNSPGLPQLWLYELVDMLTFIMDAEEFELRSSLPELVKAMGNSGSIILKTQLLTFYLAGLVLTPKYGWQGRQLFWPGSSEFKAQ